MCYSCQPPRGWISTISPFRFLLQIHSLHIEATHVIAEFPFLWVKTDISCFFLEASSFFQASSKKNEKNAAGSPNRRIFGKREFSPGCFPENPWISPGFPRWIPWLSAAETGRPATRSTMAPSLLEAPGPRTWEHWEVLQGFYGISDRWWYSWLIMVNNG